MKSKLLAASLLCLCALPSQAVERPKPSKLDERIASASEVLQELMSTPDKIVPARIAARAKCVVIVPGFKKGAFLVGAQYGQGVATCRNEKGWSAPVFIQMTGASFGLQAGGQSTDLVLVGVNRNSLDDLLKDKIKLGGDVAIAAGPLGRNSQAATDGLADAEFLSYSRSRGVFAGVDLTGDVVNQNKDDTKEFYGKEIAYKDLLTGKTAPTASAKPLLANLDRMFRRHGSRKQQAGDAAARQQPGDTATEKPAENPPAK